MKRPETNEYQEYYGLYVDRVPPGDVVETLRSQLDETLRLLGSLDDERALFRYAEDKWSIKQVLGHVIDIERVFASRCLAFARKDATALPGIEQDPYVAAANFDARPLASLLDEFRALRGSNLAQATRRQSGRVQTGVGRRQRQCPGPVGGK